MSRVWLGFLVIFVCLITADEPILLEKKGGNKHFCLLLFLIFFWTLYRSRSKNRKLFTDRVVSQYETFFNVFKKYFFKRLSSVVGRLLTLERLKGVC